MVEEGLREHGARQEAPRRENHPAKTQSVCPTQRFPNAPDFLFMDSVAHLLAGPLPATRSSR